MDQDTKVYGSFFTGSDRQVSIDLHANVLSAVTGHSDTVVPFRINPAFLESAVHTVRTGMLHGAELSGCLAKRAIDYVDVVKPVATVAGGVNSVFRDNDGRLVGDSTSVAAFTELVTPVVHEHKLTKPMAVVFGTGYAARVAVWSLLPLCGMICIVSRNPDRHNPNMGLMETMLASAGTGPVIDAVSYDDAVTDPYDIIVNATPLGSGTNKCSPVTLSPGLSAGVPREGQIYVDMAVGDHKSVFLPNVDGISAVTGMSIAAMSSALAYWNMSESFNNLRDRGMLAAKYLEVAEMLYSSLSEP